MFPKFIQYKSFKQTHFIYYLKHHQTVGICASPHSPGLKEVEVERWARKVGKNDPNKSYHSIIIEMDTYTKLIVFSNLDRQKEGNTYAPTFTHTKTMLAMRKRLGLTAISHILSNGSNS